MFWPFLGTSDMNPRVIMYPLARFHRLIERNGASSLAGNNSSKSAGFQPLLQEAVFLLSATKVEVAVPSFCDKFVHGQLYGPQHLDPRTVGLASPSATVVIIYFFSKKGFNIMGMGLAIIP